MHLLHLDKFCDLFLLIFLGMAQKREERWERRSRERTTVCKYESIKLCCSQRTHHQTSLQKQKLLPLLTAQLHGVLTFSCITNSPNKTIPLEARTHTLSMLYYLTLAVTVFTSCVTCCLLLIMVSHLSTCSDELPAEGVVALNNILVQMQSIMERA